MNRLTPEQGSSHVEEQQQQQHLEVFLCERPYGQRGDSSGSLVW
jgi:hypothetical protein